MTCGKKPEDMTAEELEEHGLVPHEHVPDDPPPTDPVTVPEPVPADPREVTA